MTRTNTYRCGLLFRLASFWIGVHYSSFDRRVCINLLPFVTFWIALPGGHVPKNVNATPESAVDSMGIPTSCGKPLCSPDAHHPLCKLHQPAECPATQVLDKRSAFEAWLRTKPEVRLWNTTDAMLAAYQAGRAALPAPQQATPGPVSIEVVGEIVTNEDGNDVRWSIEGGADAIPEGMVLLIADRQITDDTGSGEVYTSPAPGVPELTDAMLIAGLKECEPLGELIDWREGFGRDEMRAVWDAMLAAAQANGDA